jgi:hypothetical protein
MMMVFVGTSLTTYHMSKEVKEYAVRPPSGIPLHRLPLLIMRMREKFPKLIRKLPKILPTRYTDGAVPAPVGYLAEEGNTALRAVLGGKAGIEAPPARL